MKFLEYLVSGVENRMILNAHWLINPVQKDTDMFKFIQNVRNLFWLWKTRYLKKIDNLFMSNSIHAFKYWKLCVKGLVDLSNSCLYYDGSGYLLIFVTVQFKDGE